jgi:hypothetical protein
VFVALVSLHENGIVGVFVVKHVCQRDSLQSAGGREMARTEDRSAVPVEAHGETIQVASELGKGTTFTVRLPG